MHENETHTPMRGRELQDLRTRLNLTQRDFAELVGFKTADTIRRMESEPESNRHRPINAHSAAYFRLIQYLLRFNGLGLTLRMLENAAALKKG